MTLLPSPAPGVDKMDKDAIAKLKARFDGIGTWVLTAEEERAITKQQARIRSDGSKRARIRNRREGLGGPRPHQLGLLL